MHCYADHRFRKFKTIALGSALVVTPVALALIFFAPKAEATPNFGRQTERRGRAATHGKIDSEVALLLVESAHLPLTVHRSARGELSPALERHDGSEEWA